MRQIRNALFIFFAAPLIVIMLIASNALSITSEVSPDHIPVNSLYHGSKVVVTGKAAVDEEIIVKFSSPAKQAHYRKKGKAGGLLWMNVGELEFNPVSDVYIVYSTQDIPRILSVEEQDRYALGYDAFRRIVEVSPVSNEEEKEMWVKEFIKFKEMNRTYGVITGKIETRTENDTKTYSLTIDWPYQAAPQEYSVSVYAVKDNTIQDHRESSLKIEKVGALNFISNMAFNRAPFYGIISILIAIAAGFIVSVIFKGGGGGH
jgi:hypothetical protein